MDKTGHPKGLGRGKRAEVPTRTAYVDGLTMLARRELSEAQVRQRLARRGHGAEEVDAAIARLRDERAISDERVAEAIAHTEATIRRRGRRRVQRQIEHAGIEPATARRAVDSLFGDLDEEDLLQACLAARMRGRDYVVDDAELRRLYRYLVNQGFEPDRVLAALKRRHRRAP